LAFDESARAIVYTDPNGIASTAFLEVAYLDDPGFSVIVENSVVIPNGYGIDADAFALAESADVLVYAIEETPGNFQFFRTTLDDPDSSSTVSPVFAGLEEFKISDDGETLVFAADLNSDGQVLLYMIDLEAGGGIVQLSQTLPVGDTIEPTNVVDLDLGGGLTLETPSSFEFSVDGDAVYFPALIDTGPDRFELYRAELDTPGAGTAVNPALGTDRSVDGFFLDPRGDALIIVADLDTDDISEAYLVQETTLGVAQKISGALVAGGGVGAVAYSGVDGRAIYRADQDVDDEAELYLVDTDAAGADTQVNAALAAADRDAWFIVRWSEDGEQMIYSDAVFDLAFDFENDLFLVDTDALGVATRVSDGVVTSGAILAATFDLAGEKIAFTVQDNASSNVDLYVYDIAADTLERVRTDLGGNSATFFQSL
ncbi:MAG: hypothetical protein MJA83_13235, partial [Gammaproteobacteria bacterium]|nr:hypothetical protein [Gammaproteobacteria bacterium]